MKHSEAFAEQGQAFVFWSPESFQANIAWTTGGKILSKQARHPSWHCQFSCVLGVSLTSVFLNSRWMAISTGFCEERVLIPHHTIFEEVVGKWFIHKASIGSISCGMFCVGARRDFQNHLQQFGAAIQNVQLIFMRKSGLWKVPVRWHCISDFALPAVYSTKNEV